MIHFSPRSADLSGPQGDDPRPVKLSASSMSSPSAMTSALPIPRDPAPDATLALFREGYDFLSKRADRFGNVFRTRILMRDVICMRGPRAAELFYGTEGLTRVKALPPGMQWFSADPRTVHLLEGAAHRQRKALFIRMLMSPGRAEALSALFRAELTRSIPRWQERDRIVLLDEVNLALARAGWEWCGLPPLQDDAEAAALATDLAGVIESGGIPGLRKWQARLRRQRLENRLCTIVEDHCAGHLPAAPGTPLAELCHHRDGQARMSPAIAAAELLNILRPTVAVGRYIVFAALALLQEPAWAQLFGGGNDDLTEDFAEEVRRITPYFPMVGAVTTQPIDWDGLSLPKGQWLLLDLCGTALDPDCFPDPTRFRPERMLSWKQADPGFIPQGAGDVARTHRCPGEQITLELMKTAITFLCRDIAWTLPDQNLKVDRRRMPAQPASGLILADVRPAHREGGTIGHLAGSGPRQGVGVALTNRPEALQTE